MNKSELIEAMSSRTGFSKADSERALNSFIDSVIVAVSKGDKVAISGLGSFERTERTARVGINPMTKQKITIPAKKAPKFKAAKAFKDAVS